MIAMVETMKVCNGGVVFIPWWPCVCRLKLLCFLLTPSAMFFPAAVAFIPVVGGCGEDDEGRRMMWRRRGMLVVVALCLSRGCLFYPLSLFPCISVSACCHVYLANVYLLVAFSEFVMMH